MQLSDQALRDTSWQLLAQHYRQNEEYRQKCRYVASVWGRAHRSDPHAERVALSRLRNGICIPSDYQVEWRDEPRSYERDGQVVEYTVPVPINMKCPATS